MLKKFALVLAGSVLGHAAIFLYYSPTAVVEKKEEPQLAITLEDLEQLRLEGDTQPKPGDKDYCDISQNTEEWYYTCTAWSPEMEDNQNILLNQ